MKIGISAYSAAATWQRRLPEVMPLSAACPARRELICISFRPRAPEKGGNFQLTAILALRNLLGFACTLDTLTKGAAPAGQFGPAQTCAQHGHVDRALGPNAGRSPTGLLECLWHSRVVLAAALR
jgi:hypothetical protein